ncbi:MAG: rhodanese-like domain-containing protein [Clostridiales bacterium]|nr:rhodanese-like domain-containing protein [Clostridiales bacterium]
MWDLISVMQLDQWIKEKRPLFLVDIRERESYEADHISGAVCINEEELLACPEAYLKKEETTVLICYHGALSIRAARKLSASGYTVYSVSGGMEAWKTFLQR